MQGTQVPSGLRCSSELLDHTDLTIDHLVDLGEVFPDKFHVRHPDCLADQFFPFSYCPNGRRGSDALHRSVALNNLVTGSHAEQAKRLYGLDEMEAEALEVWRLTVPQTARGQNLNADLFERQAR